LDSLTVYSTKYDKIRLGRDNDGGYVICVLPKCDGISYDAFLSGGVCNDVSFEEQFLNLNPSLSCTAFDGTWHAFPQTKMPNRISFVKKNLDSENDGSNTNLLEYMGNFSNIFLKMDIEGFEFRILPALGQSLKRVKQLVVEFHTPEDINMHHDYYSDKLHGITNEKMFSVFNEINKTHTLIHFHGNNGCNVHEIDGIKVPNVFECTFIRNDFVPSRERNEIPFPTSLDMPNKADCDDIVLTGFPYTK